ncbi:MAG: DUF523 domain-containing protein [Minwuiales bacterium]|nr:DUF523 domain-containing protein [Minwuiales bacterium]
MAAMEKILVSACLLGQKVRYDGGDKALAHPLLAAWAEAGRLVPICPEVAAGFPTPRPPAEIDGDGGEAVLAGTARVLEQTGADVTALYRAGAEAALDLARRHRIRFALLTDRSPSCGSALIYNGGFADVTRAGVGVTTALLRRNGIRVFSEHRIDDLAAAIGV